MNITSANLNAAASSSCTAPTAVAAASSSADTTPAPDIDPDESVEKGRHPDALQAFLSNDYAEYVHPIHRSRLSAAPDKDMLLGVCHTDPLPAEVLVNPIQKLYTPARSLEISSLIAYKEMLASTKKRPRIESIIRQTARVAAALAERLDIFASDHNYACYQDISPHSLNNSNSHIKKYYMDIRKAQIFNCIIDAKTMQIALEISPKLRTLANLLLVCRHPSTKTYPILQAFFSDLGCLAPNLDFNAQIQKYLTYAIETLPLLPPLRNKWKRNLLYISALNNRLAHIETGQMTFIDPTLAKAINLLIYHGHIELAPKLIFDRYKLFTDN